MLVQSSTWNCIPHIDISEQISAPPSHSLRDGWHPISYLLSYSLDFCFVDSHERATSYILFQYMVMDQSSAAVMHFDRRAPLFKKKARIGGPLRFLFLETAISLPFSMAVTTSKSCWRRVCALPSTLARPLLLSRLSSLSSFFVRCQVFTTTWNQRMSALCKTSKLASSSSFAYKFCCMSEKIIEHVRVSKNLRVNDTGRDIWQRLEQLPRAWKCVGCLSPLRQM